MKKSVLFIMLIAIILGGGIFAHTFIKDTKLEQNELISFYDNFNHEKTNFYCNNTKRITNLGSENEFVNYSKGYVMNIPQDTNLNFSMAPLFVDIYNENYTIRISREWSPEDDTDKYIEHYLNRFIHSEKWQEENNVKLQFFEKGSLHNNKNYKYSREDYVINNMNTNAFDRYSFIIVNNADKPFFCITIKYHNNNFDNINPIIKRVIKTFNIFPVKGEDTYNVNFEPIIPENWTQETKDLYNSLTDKTTKLKWGIFCKDIYGEGITKTIPQLEKDLEYNFPVVLSYMHFNHDFPMDFMKKNWNNGKIVELTYQMTSTNNEQLDGYTPNIDIYRGIKDDEIRKLARAAKDFGHPFLFRVNNEMNSDWTSYSGVINLKDPQLFVSNWQRFFNIFKEENVNNVIWVFNPNDRNYPPCDWNNSLAYYPGNEYVQMIGITGYNTGTYYANEMGETWREFDEIYDNIYEEYSPFFSNFPWMITEFSSSSVGGDKVNWINKMFNTIDKYKNLKIAVWFDYADYDYREKGLSKVARPYWLDETPETLNAFKIGLKKYQP